VLGWFVANHRAKTLNMETGSEMVVSDPKSVGEACRESGGLEGFRLTIHVQGYGEGRSVAGHGLYSSLGDLELVRGWWRWENIRVTVLGRNSIPQLHSLVTVRASPALRHVGGFRGRIGGVVH